MGRGRGGKVKTMKISSTNEEDVKDLQKLFSQITGSTDADRDVIIPKINSIYETIIGYYKLYNIMLSFEPFTKKFSECQFWFDDISEFLRNLTTSTNTEMSKNYATDTTSKFHEMDNAELNEFYKTLKANEHIKKIIITSSNLAGHKKHLTADQLDDTFIKREPGMNFQPLAFSSLDLKVIWAADINEKDKTFVLSLLRRTYEMGIKLYDIITSPDVDIKKFSRILVDNISNMKKMIPRCDKAFSIIENSVSMLEDNFKSYFRNSVEAGNPSIIIESFIVDISTSQKANASVTREFRRIVAFLKEKSAGNTDPKIKKLFGMLNSQFSAVDVELGIKQAPDNGDNSQGSSEQKDTTDNKEEIQTQREEILEDRKVSLESLESAEIHVEDIANTLSNVSI